MGILPAALVARAHALVRRLCVVAVRAGFHLNTGQGAVILILAVVIAAGHAAANILVGLLVVHLSHLIYGFAVSGEMYCAPLQAVYAASSAPGSP